MTIPTRFPLYSGLLKVLGKCKVCWTLGSQTTGSHWNQKRYEIWPKFSRPTTRKSNAFSCNLSQDPLVSRSEVYLFSFFFIFFLQLDMLIMFFDRRFQKFVSSIDGGTENIRAKPESG